MAVWVGSSGPALCSLGAVKKMCRMLFPAHAFRLGSGGFSAFGLLCFRGGGLLFRLFCRLLFFGFPGSFLFRFLHFLYPFLQTFMPFLIFFLVGGFDKSVLVGEVHVCEVPQQLGCVVVPVAVLTKEVADEVPFDYRLLCVRQFGNDFHPLFLVQCERLVLDAEKREMSPLKLGKHGEINHTVLVLRERAFGVVVLPDNLFRVGNGLFDRELFETLVPFLQCPDSDGAVSFLFIST